MRWTTRNWQNMRNNVDVVRMNTLINAPTSKVGVVVATNPHLRDVTLRVAYRNRGKWQLENFQSSHAVTVLTESTREHVIRAYRRQNLKSIDIGKGFAGYLGADPEIFAVTKDNRVLPAWEFLPEKGPGNEIFWDGFQAEFTTKTETCLAWFLDHVRTGLVRVHKAAQSKGGQLALADVIEVPTDILEKAADEHVRFGCDPSKNAYNDFGQLDAKPRELEIRFAGGHKHFGGAMDEQIAVRIVKALDAIWGVMSVSLFEGLECPLRRAYYGKAGEYRLPLHGLEYRTPSNAWLCHPAIAQLSWTMARQAYQVGRNDLLTGNWNADENEIRRVINELDVPGARTILRRNKRVLRALLASYFAENHGRMGSQQYATMRPLAVKHGMRVILEGAVNVLEAPKDLVRNWMLDAPTDNNRWYTPGTEEARLADTTWHFHSETGMAQWAVAAGAIERGEKI